MSHLSTPAALSLCLSLTTRHAPRRNEHNEPLICLPHNNVYAYVLGNDETGQPRAPCYGKLERAVSDKKKQAIKKASDACGERKGPKIADVATATGLDKDEVRLILLRLRTTIKDGNTCANLLALATTAAQEGEGGGANSTATAAGQPPEAPFSTSSLEREDAMEGAEAGSQSAGAGETASLTTTTAGCAGAGGGANSTATAAGQPAEAPFSTSSLERVNAMEGAEAGSQSAGAGETASLTTTTAGCAGDFSDGAASIGGEQGGTAGIVEANPVQKVMQFVYHNSDYDGEFKSGADGAYVPHGKGKMTGQATRVPCNGRVYTGTFDDGHPVDGTIHRPPTAVAGHGWTWTGKIDGFEPSGKGLVKWPKGTCATWEGPWPGCRCTGVGKMTFVDGTTREGMHTRSKPDGEVTITRPGGSVETVMYSDGKVVKEVNRANLLVADSSDGEEGESPTGPARREQSDAGDAAANDRMEEEKPEDEEETPTPAPVRKRKRKRLTRTQATIKKRKWAITVNKKAKAGYLPVHGHEKSTGGLRRCMHDMAINGATRLGVTIDAKQLLEECKPRRTVDTSFEEIETAPSVAAKIKFTYYGINQRKGGNEAALLSIEDGGVYAVMAQVDGKTSEYHAFVYDSCGIVPGPYTAHSGIVIDNRKKSPIFLIDKEDRSSVSKKRDVLNDFFGARTFVMHVYRMEAVGGM